MPVAESGAAGVERAPFRRVDGHGERKGCGRCPLAVRFGALPHRTDPPPLTPETSETPHDADAPDAGVAEGGGLVGVLRTAARSLWPSPIAVAREAARLVTLPRCGVAVRGLRVAGVLSLSGLALSADQAHLRRAFSHVASSFDREPGNGGEGSSDASGLRLPLPPARSAPTTRVRVQRTRRPPAARRLLGPVGFPVRGPVSSPFGLRVHPVSGRSALHHGVDLAVPVGTPVRATATGRVVAAGVRPGYGLTVEVEHGRSGSVSTLYAHLDAVPPGVGVGAVLRRGGLIGWSGGVGPRAGVSTGPHVHYEVRVRRHGRQQAVDPARLSLVHRVAERRWQAPISRVERRSRPVRDPSPFPANVHLSNGAGAGVRPDLLAAALDIQGREAEGGAPAPLRTKIRDQGGRFLPVGGGPVLRGDQTDQSEPRSRPSAPLWWGPLSFSSLILNERDPASSFNNL